MAEIATLKKINLRDVWKDEGQFSDWLAENLSRLGDELGMALERSEREKAVGPFSADIICADQISKFDVVIENQFTRTDHDHLGKMITYASGLQSQIIIWVAPRFRDEHRSAIDWLNDISGPETGFFGVVLEVFQISDSAYAPHFDIVARPNDWQRQVKRSSSTSRGMPPNETALKLMSFWEDVRAYFEKRSDFMTEQSSVRVGNTKFDFTHYFPSTVPRHYLRAKFNRDITQFHVEIFLSGSRDRPEYSQDWLKHLMAVKDEIEEVAGAPLIWDNPEQNVEMSIRYKPETANIDDTTARTELLARIYDDVHCLDRAFRPHVEAFVETNGTL
ncbi:MAG: hypothetical protein CMN36_02005 [SAR116 cluster bacterium]|nr:hypothetical protein [SAR116 cluster bacterium]HCI20460.1 hypothetical protein [Alphaproteobacteria bacterium]|tara:strand:+ start:274 stop:1269 length:996 start_codon:yes stop_codon:yes gene_type:complete